MKNTMNAALRQAMQPRTLLVVLAVPVLLVAASLQTLLQIFPVYGRLTPGIHTQLILNAVKSDIFLPFVPILGVLPFAGSYMEDLKSKFLRFLLIRQDYRSYLLSRVLTCFLLGGGVLVLGILLSWGGASLALLPLERKAETPSTAASELLEMLWLLFLNGGLWAVVGLAMSTLMESKYIAYVSPFIFYYLLVILCQRYLPNAFLLYPQNWTNPAVWPYGAWSAALFLVEVTAVFGIVFALRAGRRLREL